MMKPDFWRRFAAILICLITFAGARMACGPHRQQFVQAINMPQKELGAAGKSLATDHYGVTVVMPSPNWDERPAGTAVTALVVHATATRTGQEAVNTFLDPKSKRSSHFVIDRNGAVIEMVAPEHRAWHAGASALNGVADLNNFSIGIELVDQNDGEPYSDAQYVATAALIRRLRMHYDIPDARIVSHAEVALPRGRKSDPVGFDFDHLYAALKT